MPRVEQSVEQVEPDPLAKPPNASALQPSQSRHVPMEVLGPKLWRELHWAKNADAAWLARFMGRIPCGPCRLHWSAVLAELPPVFGGGWLDWTIRAHDAINWKLGKPEMGVDAGRKMWG